MSTCREKAIQDFRTILGSDNINDAAKLLRSSGDTSISELVEALVQSAESLHHDHHYLTKTLPIEMKYSCIYEHYSFLVAATSVSAFDTLISNSILLYDKQFESNIYTVSASITRDWSHEGELSLEFKANNESLYILSFTIIPGVLVGLPDLPVALISRMQGMAGKFEQIRLATKEIGEVSPQAVLYAAIMGIAQAIGVRHIAGPSAANQVSCVDEKLELFRQAYDDFFISVGAAGPQNGFYIAGASPSEKPLASIKAGHRLRTKHKRKLKAEITTSVFNTWRFVVQQAPHAPDGNGLDNEKFALLQTQKLQDCIAKLIEHRKTISEIEDLRSELNLIKAERNNLQHAMSNTIELLVTSRLKNKPSWMSQESFHYHVLKMGMFDSQWYLDNYADIRETRVDPIEHYLKFGANEGRDPNAFFVTHQYLVENPDVQQSGINPLVHYCLYGASEGRNGVHRSNPNKAAG